MIVKNNMSMEQMIEGSDVRYAFLFSDDLTFGIPGGGRSPANMFLRFTEYFYQTIKLNSG